MTYFDPLKVKVAQVERLKRKAEGYESDEDEAGNKTKTNKQETLEAVKEEVKDYMAVVESLRKKMETIEGNIATEEKTNKLLQEFTG